MKQSLVSTMPLGEFALWDKVLSKRALVSIDLEITARCNNACRHCYISLPAGDEAARSHELSLSEIKRIADQAAALGAIWCLITGGEPLLRADFGDIYVALKRRGFLVSVFTNATLVTGEHLSLFRRFPPRDLEVSVYGVTEETYERATCKPGSFAAFRRGLGLLLESEIPVRLKAMALRSNAHELSEIIAFCQARTSGEFRFDPLLHLRYDGDVERNAAIRSERLSADEIVDLERADPERFAALQSQCDRLIDPDLTNRENREILQCGAGVHSVSVGYDGTLRLCASLWHPQCTYDLRSGNLLDGWREFIPRVRAMRWEPPGGARCQACSLVNLCLWCPAHAHLETGALRARVDYFCEVARARAASITGVDAWNADRRVCDILPSETGA